MKFVAHAVFLVLAPTLAQANLDTRSEFISQLQAPWLRVLPAGEGQSKPAPQGALKYLFKNTITDKPARTNPEECSHWSLENEMMSRRDDFDAQTVAAQNFINRCDKTLRRWGAHTLPELIKLVYGNYEILKRPHIFEAIFALPYGTRIHGLLAIKDMETPRPFVIVICGTGCNINDAVARENLLTFYDVGPFNVLVLPSLSGTDFIRENHTFAFGGLEEGRQTFELVRLLGGSDSPLRKIISSFHIFGQSLGGNGALFSAVYASANNQLLAGPKIQSVFGYHPVVDLKASLLSLDRNDFTGRIFNKIIMRTIEDNLTYVPGFSNANTGSPFKPGSKRSVAFLQNYVFPRYQLLASEKQFLLAPFTADDLKSPDKYWASNNFMNFFKNVTVPTLAFVSTEDFIVDPKVNGLALERQLAPSDKKFVNVLETAHGAHTAIEFAYGPEIFAALVQSFILSHSPEFDYKSRPFALSVSFLGGQDVLKLRSESERYFGYSWRALKNKTYVTFDSSIFDPTLKMTEQLSCSSSSPYFGFEKCFRHAVIKVPLTDLHLKPVFSDAQAHALTRFLNFRVKALNALGHEPIDTTSPATHFEWYAD